MPRNCTKCLVAQDLSCFSINRRGLYGKASWCRGCFKQYDRLSYRRQYNVSRCAEYRSKNLELCRAKDRERAKRFPEDRRASTAKYKAKKIGSMPPWLTKDQKYVIDTVYLMAHALNHAAGKNQFHVDHIMPLQGSLVSGLHVPWNLRIITRKENLVKKNKLLNAASIESQH